MWERGLTQSPAQRALTLLAVACAETPIERCAQLSIGRRDAQLLALRERTFGPHLASIATCPACETRLEFHLNAEEIRSPASEEQSEVLGLTHGSYEVQFRLRNSLDLATIDPPVVRCINRTKSQCPGERDIPPDNQAQRRIALLLVPAE